MWPQIFTQSFITILKSGTCLHWGVILSKNYCQALQVPSGHVSNIAPEIFHLKTCTQCTTGPPLKKILLYKNAIGLYKLYNYEDFSIEWVSLNVNQILTSRQTKFVISKAHIKKVGINALANRLYVLNSKIPLYWLNFSYVTFKFYCKKEFLSCWYEYWAFD